MVNSRVLDLVAIKSYVAWTIMSVNTGGVPVAMRLWEEDLKNFKCYRQDISWIAHTVLKMRSRPHRRSL